jgi:outer membrane lipoprotein-sorting protein
MRRLVSVLVLVLVLVLDCHAQQAPDEATKFLKAWADRLRDVKSLHVEFTQTKELKILRRPLVSKGVVDLKGKKLLMTVDSADGARETELQVDAEKGEVRLHYPQLKRLEVFETSKGGAPETPFPFFSGDVERLPETHTVALEHEKDKDEELSVLVLAPRDPASRAGETRMVFRKGELVRVRQTTRDGEKLSIEIAKFEVNADVPDARLELHVPEGTEVVRPLGR